MKKNTIIGIVVVLLVLGIGISFAYFVSGILVSGNGSNISITPGDMLKVEYDAGSSKLVGNKLMPGDSVSKDFSVTITPTETEKEVIYGIFINLTNNTFVKCDDSNYDELTNVCSKGEEEISYTLTNKDTEEILASGDLTGKSGKIRLITEEKEVESKRVFNYTITITFKDTGKDQNHNQNKGIEGNIEVEFSDKVGSEYILSHYDTVLTRNDFSTTVENTTTGTIYKSLDESQYDDDGEVYYFAGAPTDNYVKFAGFYWRIIRINGDGSLRIIYDGTSAHGNGESSDDRQIDQRPFNSLDDNNMYVGYMYTEGEVHGLKTSSTIKDVLDNWYIVNVLNKGYSEYVSMEAGFCGDREPSTDESISNGSGGTGTIQTYYGAYIRLVNRTKSPTLKCKNNDDMYTVSESNRGNNALSNPIGLITADEVAMAGLLQGKGTLNSYLYIGQQYWTMSPFRYITLNVGSDVFSVSPTSGLNGSPSEYMFGVRPVINLASDVELTGSGTSEDPYVVKGA